MQRGQFFALEIARYRKRCRTGPRGKIASTCIIRLGTGFRYECGLSRFAGRTASSSVQSKCLNSSRPCSSLIAAIMQFYLRENMNLYKEHRLSFAVLAIEIQDMKEFEHAHSREALSAIMHVVARSISHMLGGDAVLGHWNKN